jgi:hypothetical protein
MGWIAGFMSGINVACGLVHWDWDAGEAFMRKYCADHPLDKVTNAATEQPRARRWSA